MMPESTTSAGPRVRALRAALAGADPVRVAAWVGQLSGCERGVRQRRKQLREAREDLREQGGVRTRTALAGALLELDTALRDHGETARLAGIAVAVLHRELELAIDVVGVLALRSDPAAEATAERALLRWQGALVSAHSQFGALREVPAGQPRAQGPATGSPGTARSVRPTGPVPARFASSLQLGGPIAAVMVADADGSASSAAATPGQAPVSGAHPATPGAGETAHAPAPGPTTRTGSEAVVLVAEGDAGSVGHHRTAVAVGGAVVGAVGVAGAAAGLAVALRAGSVPGAVLTGRVREAVGSSLASPVSGRNVAGTAPGLVGGLPWIGSGAVHRGGTGGAGPRRSRAEPSRGPEPRSRQEHTSTSSGLLR